jgi:hypothetical protein
LAGNDFFRIMALSGHKTMKVFRRYNLVSEKELRNISWKKEECTVDTNMDTKAENQ